MNKDDRAGTTWIDETFEAGNQLLGCADDLASISRALRRALAIVSAWPVIASHIVH